MARSPTIRRGIAGLGGAGDDIYFVEAVNDVVIENPGEGSDEVRIYGTDWTVSDGVETVRVLTGSGTVTGNEEPMRGQRLAQLIGQLFEVPGLQGHFALAFMRQNSS